MAADERAQKLGDDLIAHLGGRDVWSRGHTLSIDGVLHLADGSQRPEIHLYDLDQGRIRFEPEEGDGGKISVLSAHPWSFDGARLRRPRASVGEVFTRTAGSNLYVLLARLARRDLSLSIRSSNPATLEIFEAGAKLAEFTLDETGRPVTWLRFDPDAPQQPIEVWKFGPLARFGELSVPGIIDEGGGESFEVRAAALSNQPAPDAWWAPPASKARRQ